jgi:ankyrin repeat protein
MKPEIWDWLQNNYFSVVQPVLKNTAGIYPLILASQQGRSDVIYFLIEQNAALDVIDQYGNNALWAVCYAENSDYIEALIHTGVDINHQNSDFGCYCLDFRGIQGQRDRC